MDWTTKGSEFEYRWGEEFLLLHVVQTGSERVSGAFSPGVKLSEHEAEYSRPTSVEVKKMWVYTSISPYAFMA
jgi:hypothetical protein